MRTQNEQIIDDSSIHLLSSVRAKVEEVCAQEGATLNEFVNVAVAEKLAHYAHMEWVRRRKTPTEARIAEALRILNRPDSRPPDPGDELPKGYVPLTANEHV